MANSTAAAAPPSAQANVFARSIGIITAPKATFQGVVANPKILGMLALVCLLSAAVWGAFFATRVGQGAWLEAATTSPFAGDMSDQQYAAMEKMAGYVGYLAMAQALIGIPLGILLAAGILFAVFNAALGGDATFKQLYAVVLHSWVILVLSLLFTLPLSYWRGTLSSGTNLGVLLPMIDEASFLGRFAGMMDLFWIWSVIVLAIGLGVLYRRRTQPIAMTLFGIYALIAIGYAVIASRS